MSKKIYFVGGGNFAQEVKGWLRDLKEFKGEFAGYLDVVKETHEVCYSDTKKPYNFNADDRFICVIADPLLKKELLVPFKKRGAHFINVIHPSSVISDNVKLGTGVIVYPFVYIGNNAQIGNFVSLNTHVTIGHDVEIGDYCTLSGHSDLTGFVKLEEGVFMGTHAAVIPKLTVGKFAKIGAGSVAMRHVKSGTTVIGVPAREL